MNCKKSETVVILGASDNPDRYSYKAQKLLTDHGHKVIPVHPRLTLIEGVSCVQSLDDINLNLDIDTLTLYVNPKISETLIASIIKLAPNRVIMNPGTENSNLKEKAEESGIEVEAACTLVLLNTNQY